MSLKDMKKDSQTMLRIGLVFLVLFNLTLYFARHSTRFGAALTDGTAGVFLGLAVGCLILSLRAKSRRCATDGR